jgi:hypothetical protein
MAEEESLRQVAQGRASLSAWFGIVCLFALFGVIVIALVGPMPRGSNYEQARAKKRFDILKTEREENTKALTTYAWIDKTKGIARIPVDRAIELAMAELRQKKPAPAYPIVITPPPAPAPPAPPSGKPAASPSGTPIQSPAGTPTPAPMKTS